MKDVFRILDRCLADLDGEGFVLPFLELVQGTGAHQIMVFALQETARKDGLDRMSCLVSRNFRNSVLAAPLASRYLDGGWQRDPLVPELRDAPEGSIRILGLSDLRDQMDDEYRETFFDAPELPDKTAILCVGRSCRLIVNLYHGAESNPDCISEVAALIGRLAVMHFDRGRVAPYPSALSALSEQERTVCLGILAGKKAEAIAGEMNLAASTVVTYRKRAYGKLGISSRGLLFALCRE